MTAPRPEPGSKSVAVIGAGHVGLTTAVCLAQLGHEVICADSDRQKVERLRRGDPTFVEDGIGELLREGLASGRLRVIADAVEAVVEAEFSFLCLPTPGRKDGTTDVTALEEVVRRIAPRLRAGAIVVTKSTVPMGSVRLVEELLRRPDVAVVSNPEFLRESTAVRDTLHPDRIVVGAEDPGAAARVADLFAATRAPLLITDPVTAETVKYASNAYLATKLSFANSLARVCELVGADMRDVLLGMGYDSRIGFDYMRPGPGWGGSCLPKDVRALAYVAESAGYEFRLLHEVLASNEEQMATVARRVLAAAGERADAVVAVWGLTFKAGTDDQRDSPALNVVGRLLEQRASVRAFDPTVTGDLPGLPGSLELCFDPYAACEGASVLAVLTEWDEFRWLDFQKVKGLMAAPSIVDTRNLLDPAAMRRLGFDYVGIGRP